MKKGRLLNFNVIIISILVLFIVYLFIESTVLKNSLSQNIYKFENALNVEKSLGVKRDFYLRESLKNNGSKLYSNLSLVNEDGVSLSIRKLIKDRMLIFRFSQLHCDLCVDKQFESIKRYIRSYGTDNLIILTEYSLEKNLILFKRLNSINIPIYNVKDQIKFDIEQINTPYFFILGKDYIATDFFIPIKEIGGYTEKYLEIVHSKYFK